MKRVVCGLLILLLLLPAALAEASPRTISVKGSASVTVDADIAMVYLAVRTDAKNVSQALAENAERLQAVIGALTGLGIAKEDIVTQRFRVDTNYDYSSSRAPKQVGFTVTNGIKVSVKDMTLVGQVIDLAFAAGASECDGVDVSASEDVLLAADDAALTAAIAEGKRRAQVIAAANGDVLGRLISVNDGGTSGGFDAYSTAAVVNSAYGTQIVADGITFKASVVLVFEVTDGD